MKRNNLWVVASVVSIAVLTTPSIASAEQTRTYNVIALDNPGWFDGFWASVTLPSITSGWVAGQENKVNLEFWFGTYTSPIATRGNWVEMGYHVGYDWNSTGGVDASRYYTGLFSGTQGTSSFSIRKYPEKSWSAGQTHTFGTNIDANGNASMRADGATLVTYSGFKIPDMDYYNNNDSIDIGLEWGTSNNATQSAAVNSSTITDLNVHNSAGWTTWSKKYQEGVNIATTNTNTKLTTYFNQNYNSMMFY